VSGFFYVPVAFYLVWILFTVLICVVAYKESESFARQNGTTPWGLPSWAWVVFAFVQCFVTAILLFVARRTTKPVDGSRLAAISGSTSQGPPAAGWYPDPQMPGQLRFWDGYTWTGHTAGITHAPEPALPPFRPS
jgi:hypothetical protein